MMHFSTIACSLVGLAAISTAIVLPAHQHAHAIHKREGTNAVDGNYVETVLKHHNAHRSNHSASALTWSDSLAKSAEALANTCVWGHNVNINGGNYGQNLAAGTHGPEISSAITDMWYNGEEPQYGSNYGAASPDMAIFENIGHFTQVVWKGTQQVGCFTSDCSASGWKGGAIDKAVPPFFTVCNYAPTGNMMGSFAQNVGQPLGQPGISKSF